MNFINIGKAREVKRIIINIMTESTMLYASATLIFKENYGI
jgi:hypothetical protein